MSRSHALSLETLSCGTRGLSTGELHLKSKTTEWQSVRIFVSYE